MSFPTYAHYKDSGVEWLGEVPAHWETTAIKRYCLTITDGAHISPDTENGAFCFVSTKDVQGDLIDFEGCLKTSAESYELMVRTGCKPHLGDVLFSKDGTIGRTTVVRGNRDFVVASSLIIIRPDQDILDSEFLNYLCMSRLVSAQVDRFVKGAGLPRLSIQNLQKVIGVIPPIQDQTAISAFLDRETTKLDALITEQRTLIDLLKEKRQAVISHAVTKGLDPRVPMKDSGVEWLGEVPAHWDVRPLKKCVTYQEGPGIMAADFQEIGTPLLRISCVQGPTVTLDGCNFLNPEKATRQWGHFKVEVGDLLISGSASMGIVSEVGEEAAGAIPYTGLIRLQGRSAMMDKEFIWLLVVSDSFLRQVEMQKTGSTIQHFGPTHLDRMTVVCPPLQEQLAIARHVADAVISFDRLANEARLGMGLLHERRSALISAAVTGKIDVRQHTTEAA